MKEIQQIRTLVRQIAEAKTQTFMEDLFREITGFSSNGSTTTVKRKSRSRKKVSVKNAKADTVDGTNRILKFIQAKGAEGVSALELKPAVGLPTAQYQKAIAALKQEGKIKQKGLRREATYLLK